MIRKTVTILSLIGLLLSVGLWGVSMRYFLAFIPKSLTFQVTMSHGGGSLFWPDKPFAEMSDFVAEMTEWRPSTIMAEQTIQISPWESIRVPAEGCASAGFDSWKISCPWHLGFRFPPMIRRQLGPGSPRGRSLFIPFWIPTLLFAAVFWRSFSTTYRRRKCKKLGLCLKCGYDLRASKERCPECGEAIG